MIIAVTPGDPNGIGPEVVWKAIRSQHKPLPLLCIGARKPFDQLGAKVIELDVTALQSKTLRVPKDKKPFVWLLPAPLHAPRAAFLPGYQSGWSIETATRLIQSGRADALVTGPISKERLQKGGYLYPGHTEFLAALCGIKEVTMMLANEQLRITLVTTHTSLKRVPALLTRARIRRAVIHTAGHLRKWWGIPRPKIAITALNPHAGEAGLFGDEEIRVISPEIASLKRLLGHQAVLSGPHPADTLFAKHIMAAARDRYDAVVCMYHDQGLIPVKLLDFPHTVNVTLGLPIIRTSVDHGVGFDIAGKNLADPSSLQSAIQLAIRIARNKKRTA